MSTAKYPNFVHVHTIGTQKNIDFTMALPLINNMSHTKKRIYSNVTGCFSSCWQVSLVLDRLLLMVFFLAITISSLVILTSSPYLYDGGAHAHGSATRRNGGGGHGSATRGASLEE